jgi:hypothetical protein
MALNFPTSPTDGQLYTDDNGTTWQYTTDRWAPMPAVKPVPTNYRNVIIGGDFTTNPWQRGTSATGVTNSGYVADRWLYSEASSAVVTISKTADAPTAAEAGVNTDHCHHIDVTTADASIGASEYAFIAQKVEGYNSARFGFGEAGTRYITISFWHKHTVTGTYGMAVCNAIIDRAYISTYTQSVADTWEKAELTVPVDTTGTWNNDSNIGLYLIWTIAAGSTFQGTGDAWNAGNVWTTSGQVNGLSSTANNFKLALVQIEAGSQATDFEARDVGTELALCQRYYQARAEEMFSGDVTNTDVYYDVVPLMRPMRVAPTVTATHIGTVGFATSAPNIANVSTQKFRGSKTANATTGGGFFQFSWTADAEL